jgi:hypothetical protein
MRPFLLAIVLFIAVAALFFLTRKKSPSPRTFKNTQDFINFLSAEAMKDAEMQSHVQLDYSVESIKQGERILGGIHDQYAKNHSSIAVNGLASAYGAYIGEVIRRSEPDVKWKTSDSVGGEKSYPLVWAAGTPIPWPGATGASLTAIATRSGSRIRCLKSAYQSLPSRKSNEPPS